MPLVEPGLTRIFCPGCRQMKDASEFHANRARATGKQHYCKVCAVENTKTWRLGKAGVETFKRSKKHADMVSNYGITIGEYERMSTKQRGVCAACKSNMAGHKLCVDHDHETNKVRGLLCRNCNAALGLLKDDPIRIRGLLGYIRRVQRRVI